MKKNGFQETEQWIKITSEREEGDRKQKENEEKIRKENECEKKNKEQAEKERKQLKLHIQDDEHFEECRVRMTHAFKIPTGLQEDGDVNGPFQQRLKNTRHASSKSTICIWAIKHYKGLPTGTLQECEHYTLRAAKITKQKKEKKSTYNFYQDKRQENLLQR